MNVHFFELNDGQKKFFQKNLPEDKTYFHQETLDDKNASNFKDAEILGVFTFAKLQKKTLDQLPKLKMVATMSMGFDHIDLAECRKRKITVSAVPTYGDNTVAEHTFALILAAAKNLFKSFERTKRGEFTLAGLQGFDLKGKTLGVIGTGKIGKKVIQMAKAFEMNVIAFDPLPNQGFARQHGFTYLPFDDVLKQSDIITIHVPLSKETEHLIGEKAISKMKKNAILVNTARGAIVDSRALLNALKNGQVAGAALDVLEGEKLIKEESELLDEDIKQSDLKIGMYSELLLKHEKTLVTPHNAFNTSEAVWRIMQATLENIQAFQKGKPTNTV